MTTKTTTQKQVDFLYRYEAWGCYGTDGRDSIVLYKFKVIKETDCGYWVKLMSPFNGRLNKEKKWIGKRTHRPFLYDNEGDALKSFVARKLKYLSILETKQRSTIRCLEEVVAKCKPDYQNLGNGFIDSPVNQ